jgi:hypothetical protein
VSAAHLYRSEESIADFFTVPSAYLCLDRVGVGYLREMRGDRQALWRGLRGMSNSAEGVGRGEEPDGEPDVGCCTNGTDRTGLGPSYKV